MEMRRKLPETKLTGNVVTSVQEENVLPAC